RAQKLVDGRVFFGQTRRPGTEHPRPVSDESEERLRRLCTPAGRLESVVHRRHDVRSRIDEGPVEIEHDCARRKHAPPHSVAILGSPDYGENAGAASRRGFPAWPAPITALGYAASPWAISRPRVAAARISRSRDRARCSRERTALSLKQR